MTKEEKIQEAYPKELWRHLDNDGWINQNITTRSIFNSLEFNDKNNSMRPLGLQGIENNNRWIKIESEADLPENIEDYFYGYHTIYSKESSKYLLMQGIDLEDKYKEDLITHYRPISKPKPPIY